MLASPGYRQLWKFFFDDFVRLGEKAPFYAGSGTDLAKSGGKEISLRQQACEGGLLPLGKKIIIQIGMRERMCRWNTGKKFRN